MRPIVIAGPTASGKSDLAMELAETLPGEIVNADALQVYRGFDLGTAKPTTQEQARVRHHLIDILDPEERYSAGEFARRARLAIAEIEGRGGVALVVGGSGLYLRALLQGISPIPPGDEAVRLELRHRLDREGLDALRGELLAVDPETAERLAPNDSQRILRALEVAQVSGRPLSAWIADRPFGERPLSALRIGLTLPRGILYDRIAARVVRMMEEGWVEEVLDLRKRGLSPDLPAFQAIGYQQIARHLAGELSLDDAIAETIRATRRFSKRQMTWFRKEPEMAWFDSPDLDRRRLDVFKHLRSAGVEGV